MSQNIREIMPTLLREQKFICTFAVDFWGEIQK